MDKLVNGEAVALSAAEIAARVAEEAAWAAAEPMRQADAIDAQCGMPRWMRDVVIAALAADHPKRVTAEAAEAQVAALKVRG